MSTLIIDKFPINEVLVHPNADRLQIYKICDWEVISQKDKFKVGDEVIYIPIDTILSDDLEAKLFKDSKLDRKGSKGRIKAISIRSVRSYGMILSPEEFDLDYIKKNVTKYEPHASEVPNNQRAKAKRKKNKNFKEYTDIENIKWYDRVIEDNEWVVVTQKLHGTNFRAGWVPNECNTLWKHIQKFFGLLPEWEFVWGSRRVQIQNKIFHKGYYDEDVYTKMVKQYDLKNKIPKGYVLYGEIVGDKIQKDYMYGCNPGEHMFYIFDVWYNGEYLSYEDALNLLASIGFTGFAVPEYYIGPYNKQFIQDNYRDVNKLSKEVNEGVVIKPLRERTSPTLGRVILKMINPDFLLKNTSDFH